VAQRVQCESLSFGCSTVRWIGWFCARLSRAGAVRDPDARMRVMSYDLAVWEGERPANDLAAAEEVQRLYDRYIDSDESSAPTPRIAGYVQALLDRYPDISTQAGEDSLWSTAPLMNAGRGPLIYLPMVWSRCDEVSAWAVQLAAEHGLNCYDPQWDQLRTRFRDAWQFELESERGRPFGDPDASVIRKVLVALSRDNWYAILTRADDWYIQVGYGEQAGTRPGWYALERRDGAPDQHFRTDLTDIEEIIRAFVGFLHPDPTLTSRYPWRPYTV
jgi:hypothetical protein